MQLFRPHPRSATTVHSEYGNAAVETRNSDCLAACTKRQASSGLRQCGCCRWMMSVRYDNSDKLEESFDENTTRMPDDGQPTLTCSLQRAPGETSQTLVNSASDVVLSPADLPENSTVTSQVQTAGQCQCSWHGGSRREQLATLPPSSHCPVFVLTVEFAGETTEEDITTIISEGERLQDHYSSTEEPESLSKSTRNDDEEVFQPTAQHIKDLPPLTSISLPTDSCSDGPVDQRRDSEVTLSASRLPNSSMTPSDRYQPRRHHLQAQEKRQDWKALRMLSAILLAFVVTWSPYGDVVTIQSIHRDSNFLHHMYPPICLRCR